jgi:hypothetical protein
VRGAGATARVCVTVPRTAVDGSAPLVGAARIAAALEREDGRGAGAFRGCSTGSGSDRAGAGVGVCRIAMCSIGLGPSLCHTQDANPANAANTESETNGINQRALRTCHGARTFGAAPSAAQSATLTALALSGPAVSFVADRALFVGVTRPL